jgi:acyl transferase domain-containing protein
LVGDATEMEALSKVFGGAAGGARCALGSVKSMISHTMPA